jgi:hypothetical protein
MRLLLAILQLALALLYCAGGAYKTFMFDELANQFDALSRNGWAVLGVLELVGGVLLTISAGVRRLAVLTPPAAAVLALETLALAGLYARYSTELSVRNPMTWAAVMGLLAALVACGRYRTAGVIPIRGFSAGTDARA